MSLRSLNIPVIDFVGKRKIALIFSAILLIASIASLGLQGLKFGIDFTGGTLIELGYEKTANLEDIRTKLAEAQYCLLYTSPSPRDRTRSRMPSSA